MQKIYLFFCLCIYSSMSFAQTDSLSQADKAMLDSMMANDEFLKLMNEKPKNSLEISVGMGNGSFSTHNNAANATGVDNRIIYTPSVMYRMNNGFSFGITAFLTGDSARALELYQTGINAGYDYYGKQVKAGIAYTRYLSDPNKYNNKSLYQNDIYGYVKRVKGFIQPGLSAGFSNGKYKEADFRSVSKKIHLPLPYPDGRDTTITFSGYDSTDNKVSYFSVSISAEHEFRFYKCFSKKDELDFTPAVFLNLGLDHLDQVHTNTINREFVKKIISRRKKREADDEFKLQSVAASLNVTYTIGKFILQPNVYIDYYLPEATSSRWSTLFSITAGLSF